MMRSSHALTLLTVLITLGCSPRLPLAYSAARTDSREAVVVEAESARTHVFDCDTGLRFVTRIEAKTAWLFLPSGTIALPQIETDHYGNTDASLKITSEGARLNDAGKQSACRDDRRQAIWEHAKLNGADFRAVGNEPGWDLEIHNQSRLILVTDYGSKRVEVRLPEPIVERETGTTVYRVSQADENWNLKISLGPCRDSMSGETLESIVVIDFNGEELHGCGKALH